MIEEKWLHAYTPVLRDLVYFGMLFQSVKVNITAEYGSDLNVMRQLGCNVVRTGRKQRIPRWEWP